MQQPTLAWFAVRCVFRSTTGEIQRYEERITVWQASDADRAIALAEAEAADYAAGSDGEYLGLAQSFHLFEPPEHGAEVFSLIRQSELEPASYLTAFFDTGDEAQRR